MSHEFTPEERFSVLMGVARLKPGVSRAAAQAELSGVMERLSNRTGRYRGRGVNVAPLADDVVDTVAGSRVGLLTLFGAWSDSTASLATGRRLAVLAGFGAHVRTRARATRS